jgi:hypothetical protein
LKSTDGEAGLELWRDVVIKRKAKKESGQAALFSSIEKEMAMPRTGKSARRKETENDYKTLDSAEVKRECQIKSGSKHLKTAE